jgi:hypothetical protein
MALSPKSPLARVLALLGGSAQFPNLLAGVPEPGSGGDREFRGFHLTNEGRAAVAGVLVALMFLMFVAIRLDPSGASSQPALTAVSAKTLPTFWTVHTGQTFSLIAEQTGLTVEQIEDLNPYTDPGTLSVGQQIRLRPAPPAKPATGSKSAAGAKSTVGH